VALRALAIFVLLTALGLLIAHPLAGAMAGESAVNRQLQQHRTPRWDTVTHYASMIGNTEIIIATTAAVAVVLRLVCRRWREPVFLMVAVALASITFTLTTFPVERARPPVTQLDPAPPTSSFPSGHVGAATALYVGLALLLVCWRRWHVPAALGPVLLGFLLMVPLLVPLAVAVARVYRGMHFLSDVTFGVVNGLLCIAVAANAYLRDPQGPVVRPRLKSWLGAPPKK
jgi:membrane-associated phospholipid phosphatase